MYKFKSFLHNNFLFMIPAYAWNILESNIIYKKIKISVKINCLENFTFF